MLASHHRVSSSRLGHSMCASWWTKRVWIGLSQGFYRFTLSQISFHHFSTLISFISFHFIRPCDYATGVVGRHICYSLIFDIVSDTSWGCLLTKYLAFMESEALLSPLHKAAIGLCLEQDISKLLHLKSILILSSHLRLGLPTGLLPQVFPLKHCMHFWILPYMLHALPISVVSV